MSAYSLHILVIGDWFDISVMAGVAASSKCLSKSKIWSGTLRVRGGS